MKRLNRRVLLASACATPLSAPALVRAAGDAWPKGTIKFIVPFPPGGSTDPIARIIQAKVVERTGWNILIDNRPGGTGVVGAAVAAKSPPDGQTWMVTFDSHILNPIFTSGLPYKDSELFNVMEIGRTPQAIVTHPDRPYMSFADVIADAKKRPARVSVGLLAASQALVLMALIKKENGVDLNLIPYKGGGPVNQDILAGVTDVAIQSLTSFSPHIAAKKVRALAVTGDTRAPSLPDTPTLLEQGVKSFPSYSWWGVYCPAGTPRPIVEKMHTAISEAVHSPDVTRKFVEQFNMEILTTSPEEFAAYQKSEQQNWLQVVEANGITAD
jgi:tripartite-type tricarboxylate transporter receptor subunit TctC